MNQPQLAIVTLDLEPDFDGLIPEAYRAWDERIIGKFLSTLKHFHVPLTVFVVGKSLPAKPAIVNQLKDWGAEFHLHSHIQKSVRADTFPEIDADLKAFTAFFGVRPAGYRAPEGRITLSGWRHLVRLGFRFDASVFPSFWPALNYLAYPRTPFRLLNGKLIEIPFATVSPARFIFALSWVKLLGWRWYRWLIALFGLPRVVVFNLHLHDLVNLPSQRQLPLFWRLVYSPRQPEGIRLLPNILSELQEKGYVFITMNGLVRRIGQ